MSVGRPAKSERVLQHNMFRGVIEMLLRSQHCGHAHQFIIHHNGKVIGWKTVGFANNKIIHLASWQCGITQNFIVNCDGPRWSLKANHRGFAFFQPRLHLRRRNPIRATSVIAIGLVARLGFLARRVQFRSGIEGVIRLPLLNKLIQILVVNIKTLTLKVGTKVPATATFKFGSFIPINTEPLQVFQKTNTGRVAGALLIRVLNAKNKFSAATLRVGPIKKRRARAAHMKVAAGTWCKTCSERRRLNHVQILTNLPPTNFHATMYM